jgi:hypothetical protein
MENMLFQFSNLSSPARADFSSDDTSAYTVEYRSLLGLTSAWRSSTDLFSAQHRRGGGRALVLSPTTSARIRSSPYLFSDDHRRGGVRVPFMSRTTSARIRSSPDRFSDRHLAPDYIGAVRRTTDDDDTEDDDDKNDNTDDDGCLTMGRTKIKYKYVSCVLNRMSTIMFLLEG